MKKGILLLGITLLALFLITLTNCASEDIKTEISVNDKDTAKEIVDLSKIVLTDSNGNVKEAVVESFGERNTKVFVFYNLDGTYKLEVSAEGYAKYELDNFKINKSEGGGSLSISLDPLFKPSCTEGSIISKKIMRGTVNEINNLKVNSIGSKSNNLVIIEAGIGEVEEVLNFTEDTSFHVIKVESQDYSIFLKSKEEYYRTFEVFCGNAEEYVKNYKGFFAFFGKLFCKLKNFSNKGNQYSCILKKSLKS